MNKFLAEDVSFKIVSIDDLNDPSVAVPVHRLGHLQAAIHADVPAYMPDELQERAPYLERLKQGLANGALDVVLVRPVNFQGPDDGAALLVLSPLWSSVTDHAGTRVFSGIQVEDVIVDPFMRGRNLGQHAMNFTAVFAAASGLDSVGWECMTSNPAQKMYRMVGAETRAEKPFRLSRPEIATVLADQTTASMRIARDPSLRDYFNAHGGVSHYYHSDYAGCLVSQRISNLRMSGYRHDGKNQETITGYQIEGIDAQGSTLKERVAAAEVLINRVIAEKFHTDKGCTFIDLVGLPDDPFMTELVKRYGAEATAYSGSDCLLWFLKDEAFENAAMRGQHLVPAT